MSPKDEEFLRRLDDLGARIQRAAETLQSQGVLQGEARERAIAFELEHRRLKDLAQTHGSASTATLVREFEGLRESFAIWFAEIDKHFETGFRDKP